MLAVSQSTNKQLIITTPYVEAPHIKYTWCMEKGGQLFWSISTISMSKIETWHCHYIEQPQKIVNGEDCNISLITLSKRFGICYYVSVIILHLAFRIPTDEKRKSCWDKWNSKNSEVGNCQYFYEYVFIFYFKCTWRNHFQNPETVI